jgi:hypothetical protein
MSMRPQQIGAIAVRRPSPGGAHPHDLATGGLAPVCHEHVGQGELGVDDRADLASVDQLGGLLQLRPPRPSRSRILPPAGELDGEQAHAAGRAVG